METLHHLQGAPKAPTKMARPGESAAWNSRRLAGVAGDSPPPESWAERDVGPLRSQRHRLGSSGPSLPRPAAVAHFPAEGQPEPAAPSGSHTYGDGWRDRGDPARRGTAQAEGQFGEQAPAPSARLGAFPAGRDDRLGPEARRRSGQRSADPGVRPRGQRGGPWDLRSRWGLPESLRAMALLPDPTASAPGEGARAPPRPGEPRPSPWNERPFRLSGPRKGRQTPGPRGLRTFRAGKRFRGGYFSQLTRRGL